MENYSKTAEILKRLEQDGHIQQTAEWPIHWGKLDEAKKIGEVVWKPYIGMIDNDGQKVTPTQIMNILEK